MRRLIYIILACLLAFSCSQVANDILVEAEFFDDLGGWALDEQFYEQVGSAYLMAHGIGTPVVDASTDVNVNGGQKYHVWARTFNWNAPWDPSQAPGIFKVLVDGVELAETLGDKPAGWDWQYAGEFVASSDNVRIALHDLTGFDGRCDAIFLSKDSSPVFPVERKISVADSVEEYDFIVVGAGTAGLSAAISASRMGLRTLLLENKPTVGGNSSPEVRVVVSGRVHEGLYPALGNVVSEYGCAYSDYPAYEAKLKGEENLTVRTLHRVIGIEMAGEKIAGVTAVDFAGTRLVRFAAPLFADCTGDANLGYMAGADWMMGAETRDVFGESIAPEVNDGRTYGSTVKWLSVKDDQPSSFPVLPWAVQFTDETCRDVFKGTWNWEAGFRQNQIEDAEQIRDFMFRVIYGNWSHQKNSPAYREKYACCAITPETVTIFLGKRESRRLVGDYIITEKDCYGEWKNLDDAAVWATYPIDQHFPTEEMSRLFPGQEFESAMKHNHMPLGVPKRQLVAGRDYQNPYMIPYRCLYSVNIPNLFMAGRNISGSRIAMCSYRVMATTSLMGEVVGLAASLCKEKSCQPRDIYTHHLADLKSSMTAGVPRKYDFCYQPH